MAYIKHSDEWWETETAWIEKEFRSTTCIGQFEGYVGMTLKHCRFNGPPECAERIEAIYAKLTKGYRP